MAGCIVAAVQMNPIIGDFEGNAKKIISSIHELERRHQKENLPLLIVFPELSLTGYPPKDLLFIPEFSQSCNSALQKILKAISYARVIIGAPRKEHTDDPLFFNSLFLLQEGAVSLLLDKQLLPSYDIFDEPRYFYPGKSSQYGNGKGFITINELNIAVTVCEDIWTEDEETARYYKQIDSVPLDSLEASLASPQAKEIDLLINCSASPWHKGKEIKREEVIRSVSRRFCAPLLFVNQVGAQDALLFDGRSLLYRDPDGIVAEATGFQEDSFSVLLGKGQIKPCDESISNSVLYVSSEENLFRALRMGIRDYFVKQGFSDAIIGVSGGIDSALVLALTVSALGKDHVKAVMLPSRYTSKESIDDAAFIAHGLGVEIKTISIDPYIDRLASSLDVPLSRDERGKNEQLAWENIQSRIRGLIMMAIANKEGRFVIGTSNKSELATGYFTLYGDAIGAFCPIGDLLKEEVFILTRWLIEQGVMLPMRLLTKEPSAELEFDQKDSDSLLPYGILDPLLQKIICCRPVPNDDDAAVWIQRRMFSSEYKRRQAPFCFKVSEKSFGSGRRMPLVHRF